MGIYKIGSLQSMLLLNHLIFQEDFHPIGSKNIVCRVYLIEIHHRFNIWPWNLSYARKKLRLLLFCIDCLMDPGLNWKLTILLFLRVHHIEVI